MYDKCYEHNTVTKRMATGAVVIDTIDMICFDTEWYPFGSDWSEQIARVTWDLQVFIRCRLLKSPEQEWNGSYAEYIKQDRSWYNMVEASDSQEFIYGHN